MPLKGSEEYGGLLRGREGPGGGGKEKKKKTSLFCFCFFFFFFPPALGPPQPLKGLSLPSPINSIYILKEQGRNQHLLATKYFWRYLEAMLVYPDIPYFLFSMRYQEESHRTQGSNISIL